MGFGLKNMVLAVAGFLFAPAVYAQTTTVKLGSEKELKKNPSKYYSPDSTAYNALGGRRNAWISAEYVKKDGKMNLVQTTSRSAERDGNKFSVTEERELADKNNDGFYAADEEVSRVFTKKMEAIPTMMHQVPTPTDENALVLTYRQSKQGIFVTELMRKETGHKDKDLGVFKDDASRNKTAWGQFASARGLMIEQGMAIFNNGGPGTYASDDALRAVLAKQAKIVDYSIQ